MPLDMELDYIRLQRKELEKVQKAELRKEPKAEEKQAAGVAAAKKYLLDFDHVLVESPGVEKILSQNISSFEVANSKG